MEKVVMAQLFKSFIPVEFLDAWLDGDFVLGPRTLDYQYAGLALGLQGFYRYFVRGTIPEPVQPAVMGQLAEPAQVDDRPAEPDKCQQAKPELFGGYAVVHIQDNELKLEGFRIYASDQREQMPLFWKSVFSRFTEEDRGRKLYFPYHTFPDRSIKPLDVTESAGPQYLDKIETTKPQELCELLSKLCENRAAGTAEQAQLRGLCALEVPQFFSRSAGPGRKWDLQLKGKNHGVYGEINNNPISGTVKFQRLTRESLERLSQDNASPTGKTP
jgi:hypothetical protein